MTNSRLGIHIVRGWTGSGRAESRYHWIFVGIPLGTRTKGCVSINCINQENRTSVFFVGVGITLEDNKALVQEYF